MTVTIPYLNTIPNTLGFHPQPKKPLGNQSETLKYRQPNRIGYHSAEKHPNTLSSGRRLSRLSAPADPNGLAIACLNVWKFFQPPHTISSHSYY